MPETRIAAIALGANLADRRRAMSLALAGLAGLPRTTLLRISSFFETEPVGVLDQPPFLNACALLETSLAPRDLLDALLGIERSLGRDRSRERRWGPRTIDLDLILMDAIVLSDPVLTLPHPRAHERSFVLEPLAQIAPEMRHPVLKQSVRELLDALLARAAADRTDANVPAKQSA